MPNFPQLQKPQFAAVGTPVPQHSARLRLTVIAGCRLLGSCGQSNTSRKKGSFIAALNQILCSTSSCFGCFCPVRPAFSKGVGLHNFQHSAIRSSFLPQYNPSQPPWVSRVSQRSDLWKNLPASPGKILRNGALKGQKPRSFAWLFWGETLPPSGIWP